MQIGQRFSPYKKLWATFIKGLASTINRYRRYDNYHDDLNRVQEELMMYGKPYYYILSVGEILDQTSYAETVFIGDKEVPSEFLDEYEILKAIKDGNEIYYIE